MLRYVVERLKSSPTGENQKETRQIVSGYGDNRNLGLLRTVTSKLCRKKENKENTMTIHLSQNREQGREISFFHLVSS